ncbi:MAG: hypothetical protein AAFP90_21280 [Planctomycetota bacterium]
MRSKSSFNLSRLLAGPSKFRSRRSPLVASLSSLPVALFVNLSLAALRHVQWSDVAMQDDDTLQLGAVPERR